MITPRQTRLLRAPTLAAFQQAIIAAAGRSEKGPARPDNAARTAVLVPTRAAAGQLRRTLAAASGVRGEWASSSAALLTRGEWYDWLRARVVPARALLTAVEREVIVGLAARDARAAGAAPPFRLRPGLVAAVLAFYDDLRRHRRSVAAFERILTGDLEPSAGIDRGARRLLSQTRFLVETFRAYDRRLDACNGLDEHRLREMLVANATGEPVSEVIVTVPDRVAHAGGLYPADFDLLARLPRLAGVTVLATDAVLDSGYRERLDDLLPGIEEQRVADDAGGRPRLVVPDPDDPRMHFTWRDREEELNGIAQQASRLASSAPVAAGSAGTESLARRSVAVVVQRPLPYLYLAPAAFREAGLGLRAADALPLAVEPFAAALDLVLTFVATGFRRAATMELLRSPHFRFATGEERPGTGAINALDRALRDSRFTGGRAALGERAEEWGEEAGYRRAALPALRCTMALADELAPLSEPRPMAAHLATLQSFVDRHATPPGPDGPGGRAAEARARIRDGLAEIEAAHRALGAGAGATDLAEVTSVVRRWIESRTFAPDPPRGEVDLVDAAAAVYGRFEDVFIAGLVEPEWPPRPDRNIFYPGGLLAGLGWPRERDRLRSARAALRDLLGLAHARVWLTAFTLEDDAAVPPSPVLEDLDGIVLDRIAAPPAGPRPESERDGDEATGGRAGGGLGLELLDRWRALRLGRSPAGTGTRVHGVAGPQPPRAYAVTALERYLDCPFKYFARDVLGLQEEGDAERTMTARQRGLFLHGVFESFFRGWQAEGHGALTIANLGVALERFAGVVDEALTELPPGDRAVARAWLLGSAASAGLAERLFVAEVEDPAEIVDRLLEFRIDGRFELGRPPVRRHVALRGVADRIDLHADGTFRVVDYKAGRPPQGGRALQLPVYARCAEERLRGRRGRDWRAGVATYVAFGDPRLQVSAAGRDIARTMADGEARLLRTVEAIESGACQPRPASLFECGSCPYPTVCRKDYVDEP